MNIAGKEIRFKQDIKLFLQRKAYALMDISQKLLEWTQSEDGDPKILDKLEARWKKVVAETCENPADVPSLKECGLDTVGELTQDFFGFASITKPPEAS